MALIFPITYQCNLNCFYCSEKNKKHITVNIEKGIELISKNINEWIYITGGEPLLVSNIVDICRRLKLVGKKIGLTTNATIHNFDILNEVDRIGISIDGDEITTDRNRGNGTYKRAVEFLNIAVTYPIETVIMATMKERNELQEKYLENLGEKLNANYLQVTLC